MTKLEAEDSALQRASCINVAIQLSGVSNMQLVGSDVRDFLTALAQLDVHGRLIATWLPAQTAVAFALEQPVPRSKVTATHASYHNTDKNRYIFWVIVGHKRAATSSIPCEVWWCSIIAGETTAYTDACRATIRGAP